MTGPYIAIRTTLVRLARNAWLGGSLLFGLALGIRLLNLSSLSLWGDEILSIRDATELGRTWNGLLYFSVLRLVLFLTSNGEWLRLPAVVMGAAAIIPFFIFLWRTVGVGGAWLGGILYALSSFSVLYSQEIRFYGLYLLAGALSLCLLSLHSQRKTGRSRALLLVGWCLLVLSHFLGSLAVLGQILALAWQPLTAPGRRWLAIGAVTAAIAALVFAISFPAVVGQIYSAVFFRVGAQAGVSYAGARGYSLAVLAKVPFAFYFFALGESVHPLTLWISAPCVIFTGYLLLRGVVRAKQAFPIMWLSAWTLLILPIVLLFLVLDPLSAPDAGLAAPKYIGFALFPFVSLITIGILAHRRLWQYLFATAATLTALAGLAAYFQGDWSYNSHKLTRWPAAVTTIEHWTTPTTMLVADGRSVGELSYYLPDWPEDRLLSLDTLTAKSMPPDQRDIIVMAYPATPALQGLNKSLDLLQTRWQAIDGYYQNNLTLLHYRLVSPTDPVCPNAAIPFDLIDSKYMDVTLPQTLTVGKDRVSIAGGFALSGNGGQAQRVIPVLPGERFCHSLTMVSNIAELTNRPPGTKVAEVEVEYRDGVTETLPIRLGQETADWSKMCQSPGCQVVFPWLKRAQLTGNERTSSSWQQFEAHWFATTLLLTHDDPIRLQIRYLASEGQFQIWSLQFH